MSARTFWTICYLGVMAGLGVFIATFYYPMPDYAQTASIGTVLVCYFICALINKRLKPHLTNQYDTPLFFVYFKYTLYIAAAILVYAPVKSLIDEYKVTGLDAILRADLFCRLDY